MTEAEKKYVEVLCQAKMLREEIAETVKKNQEFIKERSNKAT